MGGRKDEFRRALCRAETAPIATAETYSKNSAFTTPENKVRSYEAFHNWIARITTS